MARGPICCKNLCAFFKVRRFLHQPWNCCCIGAIISLVFALLLIPGGLTLMAFYVDYNDSERLGLQVLAWLGIACFGTGILLLSLAILLWGCVWRAYQLREKTRIHLEMKQGTLFVPSAASRFNESKDSPMLPLRNMSTSVNHSKRRSLVDIVENINHPGGDVRLTKLAPASRPASVQTFTLQETSARTSLVVDTTDHIANANNNDHHRKSPLIASLQRYSPPHREHNNHTPNFPSSSNMNRAQQHGVSTANAPQISITKCSFSPSSNRAVNFENVDAAHV